MTAIITQTRYSSEDVTHPHHSITLSLFVGKCMLYCKEQRGRRVEEEEDVCTCISIIISFANIYLALLAAFSLHKFPKEITGKVTGETFMGDTTTYLA